MSNYWKKKLDELNQSNANSSSGSAAPADYWKQRLTELEKEEQKKKEAPKTTAPITRPHGGGGGKVEPKRTWFQKGLFEDGYDFGDVTKTILGTDRDVKENAATGAIGIGEKIVDALLMIGASQAQGEMAKRASEELAFNAIRGKNTEGIRESWDKTAKDVKDQTSAIVAKDLYDEEKVAKAIVTGPLNKYIDTETDSVLGEKSDALAQSAGQLAVQYGANAIAPGSGTVLVGLTSLGSEAESALQQGATFEEATLSGTISAGAEMLTEKIGGINFGGKTLTDAAFEKLSRHMTSKISKFLITSGKLSVDALSEGGEEIMSGYIGAVGQKLTYMEEKEIKEIFTNEELFESFIGGVVLGGGGGAVSAVKATAQGTDYVSGLNKNEKSVVDKVYQDRVVEAEKNGKVTERQKTKIYDEVIAEMEKGYISTDTIEEVLGDRSSYDSLAKEAEEYDTLYNTASGQLSKAQQDRLAELDAKNKANPYKDALKNARDQHSQSVFELTKDTRLSESYNEMARRGQAYQADLTKYDAKQQAVIQKAIDSGILNNTNRTHEFVDMVAKISADKGVLFDFTDNERLKDSGFAVDGKFVNGYVTKDGVTVNIDSAKSLNSIVGHEITHVLEGTEVYDALKQTLFDYAKSKGDYQSRYDSLTELYKNVKDADVEAELAADLVGDYLFTDADFINNLSTQNRNVFQKIYDEIKYLCKVATAGSKEARELERVKKAFDKAWKESGQIDKNNVDRTKYSLEKENKGKYNKRSIYNESETLFKIWENGSAPNGEVKKFVRYGKTRYYEKTDNGCVELSRKQYNERTGVDVENIDRRAEREIGEAYDHDGSTQRGSLGDTDSDRNTRGNATVFGQAIREELSDDSARSEPSTHGYDSRSGINQTEYNEGASANEPAAPFITFSNDYSTIRNYMKDGDTEGGKAIADTKYSISDSNGKQLSKEQQEYFKDSKMRDENGNLKVMYHGTPNGNFTVFKDGSYFTDNKEYADRYQNPSASSISSGKAATAPKTFEVYLDIKKPFDINDAEARNIYINDYIKGGNAIGINPYLSDAEYDKIKTIDWTEGEDLRDFLIENGYDYDGLVLDEGADGGYGDEVKSRGTSYVVFSPEQVKNIDNLKPTADPDIRFSLSESVEETKDLMALHNLTEAKLLKSLKLGGLPMPSVAIAKAKDGHGEFGEISLILTKDAIDPQVSSRNKLYSGDAWTPTYPKVDFKPDEKVLRKVRDKINTLVPYEVRNVLGNPMFDTDNATDSLNRYNGNMVEAYNRDDAMKYAYLKDTGSDISLPMKEEDLVRYGEVSNSAVRYFSGKLVNGLQTVEHYQNMSARDMLEDKALTEAVADALNWDVLRTLEPGSPEYTEYERNPAFIADEVTFRDIDRLLSGCRKLFTNGIQQTVDRKAAKELIRDTVDQAAYESWLENLFSGVIEKEGIRNNKDYFTPSGNRRSFEALHYEHNLENVIKAMRETGEKGIGNGFGGASIFGASTTEFSSIEDMKRSSDRLQMMSYEEYQELRKQFTDRFLDIVMRLPNTKNSFSATDSAAEVLTEAVAKYKTRSGIANYLRRELKGWATYSDQVVDDLIELVNDIRKMPTGYFEAKPQRAVGFDEVGVFVIPRNADIKLKQELLNRGYSIAEYDPDAEGDRQKVVNQFEEYKFSLSNVGEVQKQYGNYNISGKDIALEAAPVAANVAAVQETVSEKESVAPVAEVTDMFPDTPMQDIEELMAEAQDLMGAMEAYEAVGDTASVEQLMPEYEAVMEKIGQLEEAERQRADSLLESDVPPEMDAPYYSESQPANVENPFESRDWYEVGNRKVKAYMYENPEVKPFFQEEALNLLGELNDTTKGERWYNDEVYYESGGEKGFGGVKRHTSASMEELLDQWGMSYADIEKGLNAIIEDHGAENIAAAKKLEFMLNDRLLNGYKDFYTNGHVPPNQDYINLLAEKQITEYSKEAFDAFMANADQYAPPAAEDIAPIADSDIAPVAKTGTITETPALVNPERSVGAAPYGFNPVTQLQYEYGTIPEGEHPVRDDSLPKSTNGKDKVSLTARTVKGAEVTPDGLVDLLDKETVGGRFSYIPIKNSDTVQKAYNDIVKKGWEAARGEWEARVRKGEVSADLTATGSLLLNHAAKAGDRKAWLSVLHDYQIMGTNAGQAVQAMRILKTLTPDDSLYMIERSVDQMVEDMKLGTEIVIDENLKQAYLDAKTDGDRDAARKALAEDVAKQIPSTVMDKWTALRYLNMLGNLRTQGRNIIGNLGMAATSGVKNTVASGIEALAEKASGGKFRRTKSLFVGKDLLKAARNDFTNVESVALNGGKFNDPMAKSLQFQQEVQNARKIFKFAPLEIYRRATNWAMDTGDLVFSKAAYGRALAGYLKANGITQTDFSKINQRTLDEARAYAVAQAQEQTFRDNNWLSSWVSKVGRRRDTPKVGKMVSEGVMPFRKTPANILLRAEEYSPLGLVNSTVKSIQAVKGAENVTGADVVNSWAKTLTGTGLFALGMLLNNSGALSGGPDEDDDKEWFEDQYGWQNYSIHIGDYNFTIDFLSPSAMPLLMGAQFNELRQNGGIELKDLETSLLSIADPMIEMSMLQGVNDTLDNIRYAESNMGQFLVNACVSYLTQGLTNSFLGQLERSFEGQRMSTYVDKDSDLPAWLQKALGKASAKTPGWDYQQIPYVDAWGETEDIAPLPALAENTLSPSYISQGISGDVYEELNRLNDAQSDINVYPQPPDKTVTFDDAYGNRHEDYNLSAEEYVELAKLQGKTQKELVQEIISADLYSGLTDKERAKAVQLAYQYAREYGRQEVLGADGFSAKWMAEAGDDIVDAIFAHTNEEMTFAYDYPEKYKFLNENGVSYDDYANGSEEFKDAYNWAFKNPEKFALSKTVSKDIVTYRKYTGDLYNIKADKDKNGKSISGSRKEKVFDYINNLDADYGEKIILFKSEYPSDDTYNYEIIDYLNSREDISYSEMETILKELGFNVSSDGTITWD